MTKEELLALAGELEQYLGDPHDASSRMPFQEILRLDEKEEYPLALVKQLRRWGVPDHSMPAEHGGKAGDIETGFNLMRLVGRRDITAGTGLVIDNIAFMAVWIGGNDEQKRDCVQAVQNGRGMSWGLSERGHGSDLLANETVAEKVEGGYLLSGEKWLIGNATVSERMCVIARTGKRNGPAAYSMFVVDKSSAAPGTVSELPDEALHGLRGLDMSGARFDGVFVPDSWLLGREGQGLEIALKASQTVRAVISSFAMSAVDTALRLNLDFTEQRVLLGALVSDVPYTRRQLTETFADLMVADAVSLGAVRSLQAAPDQSSVWSSVAKYLLPTLLEQSLSKLNTVLGARMFLRGHPHYAMQQKMVRDLPVTNFADGNTVVNLRNLAQQLGGLLTVAREASAEVREAAAVRAATLFTMGAELPVYEPWKQEMSARGKDDAVLAADDGLRRLRELAAAAGEVDGERLTRSAAIAEALLDRLGPLADRATALKDELGTAAYGQAPELFEMSKEYCLLHATAACVLTYVHSHEVLDQPLPSSALLLLQLERIHRQFHPQETVTEQAVVDDVMEVLRHLYREDRLFSHWQFPLAKRAGDMPAARL